MKALILCAGFATRLYPLTENFPKPLLKIKDKPIIEYLLEKISLINEIDEIYIVTNKKFYPHFKAWKETSPEVYTLLILESLTSLIILL